MQCTTLLLALATLAFGYRHSVEGFGVSGSKMNMEAHPIIASVRFMGHHRCSGAMVSERMLLTAAQCVQKANINYLDVIAGGDNKVYQVLKVTVHPAYNPWNQDNNFAVIKVKTPFDLGEHVASIPLATQALNNFSGQAVSVEWNSQKDEMQITYAASMSLTDCPPMHQVTSQMLCVKAPGLKGDIGSPLLHEGQLHGVLSSAHGEAEVGVYARAYPYASSFVAAQMNKDPMEDDICAALQVIVEALQDKWYIPDFIISAVEYLRQLMKCNV